MAENRIVSIVASQNKQSTWGSLQTQYNNKCVNKGCAVVQSLSSRYRLSSKNKLKINLTYHPAI